MATVEIYYYPEAGGSLIRVPLTRRLSRLEEVDTVDAEDASNGYLSTSRAFRGVRRRIRVAIDRVNWMVADGKSLHRALVPVIQHLRNGGVIGLTLDNTKAYAGYIAGSISQGASNYNFGGNAFSVWPSATCAPASGDEVVISTPPLYGKHERRLVGSVTPSTYGFYYVGFNGETLAYNYESPSMLRWHGFWPALKLPQDAINSPPITNEHGISWSLDLTLEEDPAVYYLSGDEYERRPRILSTLGGTTAYSPGSRFTIDEALGNVFGGQSRITPARPR
jgi:hypothetical protein